MSQKIRFAVIAFTTKDLQDLIKEDLIKEREILNYLKENGTIYGKSPDNWIPFKEENKSISEILTNNSSVIYYSDSDYVHEHISDNLTELLSSIDVLFIDIFALYMEKYSQFSTKADYACDRGVRHRCCFLIDSYSLSQVQRKLIKNKINEIWSSVSFCYTNRACSNQIAHDIEGFHHFKKDLEKVPTSQGQPPAQNVNKAKEMLKVNAEDPTVPPSLEE